ncbi:MULTISPECIES: MMPL family transporter [Achromobacter]|uniref:MMPL family transporter n=1 Tax=Achromobacter spanius TaxID=217203 RepID=A0ABY8GUS0_9BURK|nr:MULTISPECIES: MMPL family transporter [Achromobacter]WAI82235.1 MMPL family transporter [Achromobacter spanius]WEX92323.1 MMPL family transporter [Achromobacter sp. SS2-2022]WFP08526.1 MMPL family transporter [Achromobacter spanius]
MRFPIERWLPRLFKLGLLLVLCVGAWQCRHGWPVSANLMELVPHARADATRQLAETRIQQPLSRQLLALVAAPPRADPVAPARALAARLQESGLFASVQLELNVDVPALRAQLLAGRLAMLPVADREQLASDPTAYAQRRARELSDPFSSSGLVSVDQDWLGLTRRAEQALRPGGTVQYDMGSGTLQADHGGKRWVLVRAETRADAFDTDAPQDLSARIDEARQALRADGAELLVAGGPLYAAAGRAQAMAESTWIGSIALAGIVLVLLLALRRVRALLAFVPVAVGLLTGAVACVAVFGSIHVLTLVIGASLIGVAVDFPMHWLGKSYGMPDWRAWPALRRVLPGLSISLAASLVGYIALAFTPFPALTQTAVFSAAGLLGAYACTVCQLPAWMNGWQPRPWPPLLQAAEAALRLRERLAGRRMLLVLGALALSAATVGGISRLVIQDDLRQWLSLPAPLLQQARQIGEITGFTPTSQFFLVRGANADQLLRRQAQVANKLDALVKRGDLAGYNALSQLVSPAEDQRALGQRLAALAQQPQVWKPLTDLGIPFDAVQHELQALAALPALSIDAALQGPLAERWRAQWLGEHNGEAAGMVTLRGLRNTAALDGITQGLPGVELVDRSGDLNRMFASTRIEAAELKLLSYGVAAVLLLLTLGRAATWRILAVPVAATACALAALGYLGQPLTLFSLFGLLLVSAIGVDYAIFMYERVAGAAASLVGILLGAVTTLLSFGLLAVSQTPAIANFGMAVALGVGFSLLWSPWVRPPPAA